MLTHREVFLCSVLPFLISVLISLPGLWRRWPWLGPLAATAGFVVAYAALMAPEAAWLTTPAWPPADGTDWLFWIAIPLAAVAVLASFEWRWWAVPAGVVAGLASWVIFWPVVRSGTVPRSEAWTASLMLAGAGVLVVGAAQWAARRVGAVWVIVGLAMVVGGTGVLILSSNMKNVGLYGMAGGAAALGVFLLGVKKGQPSGGWGSNGMGVGAATGLSVLAVGIMGALIASGLGYADPPLRWKSAGLLMLSPVLLAASALLPVKRRWVAGVVGLAGIAMIVGAVAGSAARKAQKDAESVQTSGY